MTAEGKSRFLNAYPYRLDDIQEIDKVLGREPILDWPTAKHRINSILVGRGTPWTVRESRIFESVFTLTDPDAQPVLDEKAGDGFLPDTELREYEKVPFSEEPEDFLRREITPYKPEAWLNPDRSTVGYEINFERYFQVFAPPRPVAEIEADLRRAEEEIARLLSKVIS
jgi:type I restriction enzyme M protein